MEFGDALISDRENYNILNKIQLSLQLFSIVIMMLIFSTMRNETDEKQ